MKIRRSAIGPRDTREPEEVFLPLEDDPDNRCFEGRGIAPDTTFLELGFEFRGNGIEFLGVYSQFTFGNKDELHKLAGQHVALFLHLFPDPAGALGEELAFQSSGRWCAHRLSINVGKDFDVPMLREVGPRNEPAAGTCTCLG